MEIEFLARELESWLNDLRLSVTRTRVYRNRGIAPILKLFQENGRKIYEAEFARQYIYSLRNQYMSGNLEKHNFEIQRRCIELFDYYCKHGHFDWLRVQNYKEPSKLSHEYLNIVSGFKNDRTENTNWGKSHIAATAGLVRQFFEYAQNCGCEKIKEITLPMVAEYLVHASKNHPKGMSDVTRSLRCLGDYAKKRGLETIDFRAAMPRTLSNRRVIMPAFNSNQVSRILDSLDKTSEKENRLYAAICLAATTGLRVGDIANLRLRDIDWKRREISIVQNKTKKAINLSLEVSAGNALADYILNTRPNCDSEYIFISIKKPYRKAVAITLGNQLRETIVKVLDDEKADGMGFHSFRRYFATALLNANTEYGTIRDMLGHSQSNTLGAYIRVNTEGLADCGLGFDGIDVKNEALL